MTLPGPIISQESLVIPRTAPTDTGTAFVVAKTSGSASTAATLLTSPRQLDAAVGARAVGTQAAYDAIDAAFQHGARRVYFAATASAGAAADFATTLALFVPELGPGQVLAVGYTGTDEAAINGSVLTHCKANNRRALLNVTGANAAAIVTAADALRAVDATGELVTYGAAFCQKGTIAGIPALGVASRQVPWTAIQAGLIAAVDAKGNPNVPAAGEAGLATKCLGLDKAYNAADRETLADAGVNVARIVYTGDFPRTYDYVTLADPATWPDYVMFNNVRTDMAIHAQALGIAERFQFKVLDGDMITVSQYGGELSDMLKEFRRIGALFADAIVDVLSDEVNPVANLAQGILSAELIVQRSPFARQTVVKIATAPITAQLV